MKREGERSELEKAGTPSGDLGVFWSFPAFFDCSGVYFNCRELMMLSEIYGLSYSNVY